jgi:hypothetical protein
VAEERAFLKDYTVPFVQLDPMKTILVFSHEHNTFDKRKLLANPHPDFIKDSPKTVNDFIKLEKENDIKKFFMEDIDGLLAKYEPGEPKMKPDVLKQISEIEATREKMMMDEQAKGVGQIMMNQPGKEPVALTIPQIAELLKNQQDVIGQQEARIRELEFMNKQLQGIIVENAKQQMPSVKPQVQLEVKPLVQKPNIETSKSEPLFRIDNMAIFS